jgi:hypothetical protein
MRMPKVSGMLLLGIALAAFASAAGQTVGTPMFDPLGGYVGTWVATNPGETSPFLILKLTEVGGALTGTMSRFTVGGQQEGHIIFRPLPEPADQISDFKISDGDLYFHWIGDTPFHGGDVLFTAQGTDVAHIMIPISGDEYDRIFADNWGLRGMGPVIELLREGTASWQAGPRESSEEVARALLNRAEFLYKSDHGVYGDYSSLSHSGELEQSTHRLKFVPIDLGSETDPLPGYVIRLLVSQDSAAYHLSITSKPSGDCIASLTSDQTGVLTESHTGDCTNAPEAPR